MIWRAWSRRACCKRRNKLTAALGRFYIEWVLMHLTWRIVTSGMNVECRAATELNWMRNRYVQALDLSPGFSDLKVF